MSFFSIYPFHCHYCQLWLRFIYSLLVVAFYLNGLLFFYLFAVFLTSLYLITCFIYKWRVCCTRHLYNWTIFVSDRVLLFVVNVIHLASPNVSFSRGFSHDLRLTIERNVPEYTAHSDCYHSLNCSHCSIFCYGRKKRSKSHWITEKNLRIKWWECI